MSYYAEQAYYYAQYNQANSKRARDVEVTLERYRTLIREHFGQAALDVIAYEAEGYYIHDENGNLVHVEVW